MIDLHDLMDERSELPPPTLDRSRLAGVRARIAARRRARLATIGSACAVVAALVVGYAVAPHSATPPHPATTPSSTPMPSPSPDEPYQSGTRLVNTFVVTFAQAEGSFTWTPSSAEGVTIFVGVQSTFDPGSAVTAHYRYTINGHPIAEGSVGISQNGHGSTTLPPEGLSEAEMRVGVPSTIAVKIWAETADNKTLDPPPPGSMKFKIGEPVPFDSYPFPPRPTSIPDLPDYPRSVPQLTNGTDLRAPRTVTLTYRSGDDLQIWLGTPGQVRVLVNGTQITQCTVWDYLGPTCWANFPSDLKLREGQKITLTVIPVHPPERWAVWVR